MKLRKLLLRYYPPGIILQYLDKDNNTKLKPIDLLEFTPDTDLEVSCTLLPPRLALMADSQPLPLTVVEMHQQHGMLLQVLLTQIINQEPLVSESKRPAVRQLLERLVAKLLEPQHSQFDLFKVCLSYELSQLI